MTEVRSPIDDMKTPDVLEARACAVENGEHFLHGYSLETDLALHYGFDETLLLALLGRAPAEEEARCFRIVAHFVAATHVTSAPVHAAMLAKRYGARTAGVTSVAAIGLAEQIRSELSRMAPLLKWLRDGGSQDSLPACGARSSDQDDARVERLRVALRGADACPAALSLEVDSSAATLVCLWYAGLRHEWQIEAAFTACRLPLALSEALRHERGDLNSYPINLPRFVPPGVAHER